jgi:hypothetical protein
MKLVVDQPARRLPGTFEAFSVFMLAAAAVFVPISMTTHVPLPHSILRYFGGACPLCGGTRAVAALFMGRVETAVEYNPLALLVFFAMVYAAGSYLLFTLPTGKRVVLMTSTAEAVALKSLIVLALVANWVYVLWAGMYRVPLTA